MGRPTHSLRVVIDLTNPPLPQGPQPESAAIRGRLEHTSPSGRGPAPNIYPGGASLRVPLRSAPSYHPSFYIHHSPSSRLRYHTVADTNRAGQNTMVRLKFAFAAYSGEKDVGGLVRIEASHASGYWTVVNVIQMEKREEEAEEICAVVYPARYPGGVACEGGWGAERGGMCRNRLREMRWWG